MLELTVGSADNAMNWLEFVTSLVASLAWPVAVVILAFLFRGPITGILRGMRKLSWGDASVEIAVELDKVEGKARAVGPAAENVLDQLAIPDENLLSLIAVSPTAAILQVWAPVEQRLQQIAGDAFRVSHGYRSGGSIAQRLAKAGKLPKQTVEVIRDLQAIRNKAAHGGEVTDADAVRFYDLSLRVRAALDRSSLNA